LHCCIVSYCIVLYCIVLYCIVLYCIVLYRIALNSINCTLYGFVLTTVLYIVLYCIALHCSSIVLLLPLDGLPILVVVVLCRFLVDLKV